MTLPEEHIKETKELLDCIDRTEIAIWLLNKGYYPEQYVVPPCFRIEGFVLESGPMDPFPAKGKHKLTSYDLSTLSFPKTGMIHRVFGIIHPRRYHDIVYYLWQEWDFILDKLFNPNNRIYSYSFPIPLSSKDKGETGPLRSGRMIYEFLEMAESDLVAEAYKYKILVRIDITNFYNSVYTHTIAWALHGRCMAKDDPKNKLVGSKLDKLFMYSNDSRSNSLPVGPAISDLMTELILTERDIKISESLKDMDFLATRFKDDYRFLCHNNEDADKIIRNVNEHLNFNNLYVNENKTKKLSLPQGLYREHKIKYENYSLKKFRSRKNNIDKNRGLEFTQVEATLLKALEIHREHSGTSLLDKFISELIDNDRNKKIGERLIIDFIPDVPDMSNDQKGKTKIKNIKKLVSLLLLVKNESPKTLAKVLSIFECILRMRTRWFKQYLTDVIKYEMSNSIKTNSVFEIVWLIYFIKRHTLAVDIDEMFKEEEAKGTDSVILKNPFMATLLGKMKDPFEGKDHCISMYITPESCSDIYLVDYLDIFSRGELEH